MTWVPWPFTRWTGQGQTARRDDGELKAAGLASGPRLAPGTGFQATRPPTRNMLPLALGIAARACGALLVILPIRGRGRALAESPPFRG